jgi:hypothetical protein
MARGAYGVAVVLAIAVAGLMFGLSGYGDLYGNDPTSGLGPAESALNDTAANESVEGGVGGQISGQDPSLVSLTVNGASSIASILAFIALLPVSLQNLGFPFWFSVPVGLVVQLMGFISMVQFVSGRILR